MGWFDRLRRRRRPAPHPVPPQRDSARPDEGHRAVIATYRDLLRTAPPEAIEQAHAEAFARLTPGQRRQVLAGLTQETRAADWARSYDSFSLARVAARAELGRPGALERSLRHGPEDPEATPLLASVAAAFMDTAVAQALSVGPLPQAPS